jgi:PAS domain S-box-containing protein
VYKLPSGEIVAIHDDITERMQAEGALKQSEQIHRSIIEFSPVGMHLYELLPDDRLIFTGANPAADRILGVDNSAFIGKTIEEAFPPLAATDVPAAYREVVKTGVPWETEQVNYESAAIAGLFHVVAFKIGENRMAATFEDITDRKQLEELRQRTQKLESLGLLAGGIAHDFNNLLGGMFGYVDLAYSELSNGNPGDNDPAEARNYLLKSLAVFDRTKALTAQLITFAKGGAPIRRVQDIAPLIRKNVEFSLSGSSVSGDCDIDEGLWHCNCDENQIGQVLDNIVINGQQAMPSGGRLVVTAENHLVEEREAKKERPAGKYVRVSIRDEGIGIPREMLPKIFDPFFTTKTKGHGLGLATVYSIVKRHGGWIDVESETGKGTTFHVFLPATEAAGAAESAAVKSSHQGHGRALIMDDEQFILETVGAMLQALGYEVVAAREGREATRIFAEAHAAGRPFAVTFLDLTIPGGRGGREVVPLLRRISPDSPVVVVSGYSEDPVMMNPESFGFSGGLVKPFRKSELSELLDRIVKNGP